MLEFYDGVSDLIFPLRKRSAEEARKMGCYAILFNENSVVDKGDDGVIRSFYSLESLKKTYNIEESDPEKALQLINAEIQRMKKQARMTISDTDIAKNAARLFLASAPTLPVKEAATVFALYPDWDGNGIAYKKGANGGYVFYNGDIYRIEQDHTSQADWTPDAAPSLFTRIRMAPDAVRVWEVPTHAENAFAKGERAHYPDADGEIYVSQRDGNTSEPGTDEWWRTEADMLLENAQD